MPGGLWVTICLAATLCAPCWTLIQSPPRMVKQPPTDEQLFQVAQQQNENDKPFLIECEAEGEPAPTYVYLFLTILFIYIENMIIR